jgi:hypothetical protein
LPRTFVVHKVSAASSPREALRRLVQRGFEPAREAVIEGSSSNLIAAGNGAGEATIETYTATRVVVRAKTSAPGLLVLTDAYDPNWHASRDGVSVAVHPTDALFRGVFIPAGESEVVFDYQPRAFRWGAAISLVTAAVCVVVSVRSGSRRTSTGS